VHEPGGLLSAMRRARFIDRLLQPASRNLPIGFQLHWLGLGREASPHTKGLHQVDDKGNRHPEMRRSRAARMTYDSLMVPQQGNSPASSAPHATVGPQPA
jgi:hypothetical protein